MNTLPLTLSDVLNRLLFQQRIRVVDLARLTGVSQPTLQRMVAGTIESPHRTSLEPIAKHFDLSIEQIKGLQPIPWLYPSTPEEAGWNRVPIVSWDQVATSRPTKDAPLNTESLLTDAKVGPQAFALIIQDASMEPLFPKGTNIIIDPDKVPKDRSYVIAKLHDYSEAIFRQLLIDGPQRYLKPLSPDFDSFKMSVLGEKDEILGVMVQSRRDYDG